MSNLGICINPSSAKELDEVYSYPSPNYLPFGLLLPGLPLSHVEFCLHEFLKASRTHLQIYPLHLHFIQITLENPNLFVQWRWAIEAHQGYSCRDWQSRCRSNHPFPFLTNRLGYYKYGININCQRQQTTFRRHEDTCVYPGGTRYTHQVHLSRPPPRYRADRPGTPDQSRLLHQQDSLDYRDEPGSRRAN